MSDLFEGLYPKVVLSPLALAAILDAHTRKGERDCLCALVGVLRDDGSLAVTDAVVNFEERGMPQKQHHESFITARQRVNPRELLLGWATTVGGKMTVTKLHDVAAWARRETKASRFIPQRRLPTPVSLLVTPPTSSNDLAVACEVRGPDNVIKRIPLEYEPCFVNNFNPAGGELLEKVESEENGSAVSVRGVAQCILPRIDQVIEIARKAKAENNEAVGRKLLTLSALPGFDIDEFLAVDREEATLFDWIKNIAQLQLQLHLKRQVAAN